MTAIYVVHEGEYSSRYIVGVYSTREKALEHGDDVTVYGLDDAPINVPTWWDLRIDAKTGRKEVHQWPDAGTATGRVQCRWLRWTNGVQTIDHPKGEILITVFAIDQDDARRQANMLAYGREIPVMVNTGSAWTEQPAEVWRKAKGNAGLTPEQR